ncbi:hypothetical protein [Dawidia soli]|uniref:Uncharacterized protein n=1 Tax=Dawidia soli TaxID=2782352 RepID=A0AAP2DBH7_9BACT|nr:hypothetical protein [Dawidia soli]MBT1688889.1 hypothetical protein [Dawidia soli]
MGRRRRRNRKHGSLGLAGIAKAAANTYGTTAKESALVLLAAIGAAGVGAMIGKHSLIIGVPVAIIGIHKQNQYLMAAGLGVALSNGFQKAGGTVDGVGIDGFDMRQIATDAKDRVTTFFKNFSEKLYVPQGDSEKPAINGLGNDEVTYFVNPYGTQELDMSEIDRVQEQIAAMSQQGRSDVSGYEIEREF